MDPNAVAASAPGVESVETVDATHFRVVSGFGVGSLKARFTLSVELSDIVEPESARLLAGGKAPGSVVSVESSVRLEEVSRELTRLHWSARADVAGTIASIGARVFDGAARRLMDRFWRDFARRTAAAAAAAGGAP